MLYKRISMAAVLLIVLTACAAVETRTDGPRFDAEMVKKLRVGETTKEEVIKLFGPPVETIPGADGEKLVYSFTEKRIPTYLGGLIKLNFAATLKKRHLEVEIKDGVVTSYRFNDIEDQAAGVLREHS